MEKKYVVRLNECGQEELGRIVVKFSGSGQKVRRANILLQVAADVRAWSDARIAEAYRCRPKLSRMRVSVSWAIAITRNGSSANRVKLASARLRA